MKRLKTSLPVGLMPVFKSDLVTIQDNLYNALYSIPKGLGYPYSFVLQGMTASVAGADLVITSGYWYRKDSNEIIYFPGQTVVGGASGSSVTKTGTTNSTKVYKDGSTQTVYEESTSGASASVISPPTNAINYGSTGTVQTLPAAIAYGANNNGTWANVTFTNSWSNNGTYNVQYRKNTNNTVLLRGRATHSGAVSNSIFTLPVGYRPPKDILVVGTTLAAPILIFIGADGTVIPSSTADLTLDGIQFQID